MKLKCNIAVALHLLCSLTKSRREWWCKLVKARWGPTTGRTPLDVDYHCPMCKAPAEERTRTRKENNRFTGWCTVDEPCTGPNDEGLPRWRQVCFACDEQLRRAKCVSQSTFRQISNA